MRLGEISYSKVNSWEISEYNFRKNRIFDKLEQFYCAEVYSELSNIIDNDKDLKKLSKFAILEMTCSDLTCSSFLSKINISDFYQEYFKLSIIFTSDKIELLWIDNFKFKFRRSQKFPLTNDGIVSIIEIVKYTIFPEILSIISNVSKYLALSAVRSLRAEFGSDYIKVDCDRNSEVITINLYNSDSICLNFTIGSVMVSSSFAGSLPSSFTTVDEWEKYLSEMIYNMLSKV